MVWGKLTGRSVTPEVRAYLEIMMMLSLADGDVEASEMEDLGITIARNPKLQDLGNRQIVNTLVKAWEDIENQGMDRRMGEVAKILHDKEQRIDAIGMAISIASADGEIEPQERRILEKLQRVLELSDANIEDAMERYR